jgi:hypothetical protein
MSHWKLGPVEYYPTCDYYRPSLWIQLWHSQIVVFFGWQTPSVLWLR